MIDARIAHLFELPESFREFARKQGLHHIMAHRTVVLNERTGRFGASRWNNLITDQFGEWLAAWFRAPVTSAVTTIAIAADDGVDDTLEIYHDGTADDNAFNESTGIGAPGTGTAFQLGSGSTTPARADYAIETAFATAPEDDQFDSATGSYAAGAITVTGAVTAGGAGTVNEAGLFASWRIQNTNNAAYYLLFHDAISPGVTFVATDPLAVTCQISL